MQHVQFVNLILFLDKIFKQFEWFNNAAVILGVWMNIDYLTKGFIPISHKMLKILLHKDDTRSSLKHDSNISGFTAEARMVGLVFDRTVVFNSK